MPQKTQKTPKSTIKPADFASLYEGFNAPVSRFDCGRKCAPLNDGEPVCCSTQNAVPVVHKVEFDLLKTRTDLWSRFKPYDYATKQIVAELTSDCMAIHCKGARHCERDNRTIMDYLRAYVDQEGTSWTRWLWCAEFSYNHSVHAATGFSPFELNYGQNPATPLERMLPTPHGVPSVDTLLADLQAKLVTAKANLLAAINRQSAQQAKLSAPIPSFQPGDKVALSTVHLNVPGKTRKLKEKWIAPLLVKEVMADGRALRLDIPPLWKIHDVINVSWLKPYKESRKFPREEVALPPAIVFEGQEHFEVERILAMEMRGAKRKRTQWFLVKWQGWPDMYNLWLPKSELTNAKDAIKDFMETTAGGQELPSPPAPSPFPIQDTSILPQNADQAPLLSPPGASGSADPLGDAPSPVEPHHGDPTSLQPGILANSAPPGPSPSPPADFRIPRGIAGRTRSRRHAGTLNSETASPSLE